MDDSLARPDADEAIVWLAKGSMRSKPRQSNEAIGKVSSVLRKCVGLVVICYWIVQILKLDSLLKSDPEIWAELLPSVVISILFISVSLFVISKFAKYSLRRNHNRAASGIPLWLSQTRLAFSPSFAEMDTTLDVDDIQSVAPDYCEGSPAIAITTSLRRLILISSETRSLLHHLYSLRPDLEPAS